MNQTARSAALFSIVIAETYIMKCIPIIYDVYQILITSHQTMERFSLSFLIWYIQSIEENSKIAFSRNFYHKRED